MKRIPIARGAGDPEQLRTPGLPELKAWDAPAEPAAALAEAEPEQAEPAPAAKSRSSKGDRPKSRMGLLMTLLVLTGLGVGGYWVWQNPDMIGYESWGEVRAAFSGEAEEGQETDKPAVSEEESQAPATEPAGDAPSGAAEDAPNPE